MTRNVFIYQCSRVNTEYTPELENEKSGEKIEAKMMRKSFSSTSFKIKNQFPH